MSKLSWVLLAVQAIAVGLIYYFCAFGLRNSYYVGMTISQAFSFCLLVFLGFVTTFKPLRMMLGVAETKATKNQLIAITIVAPLMSLAVGNCICYTYGCLGSGDF